MILSIKEPNREGGVVGLCVYGVSKDGSLVMESFINFYHGNRFDVAVTKPEPNSVNPKSFSYIVDVLFYVDDLFTIMDKVYKDFSWKILSIEDETFYREVSRYQRQVKYDFYQFLSKNLSSLGKKDAIKWKIILE